LPKRNHQIWIGVTLEPDGYFPGHEDPDKLATLDLLISAHQLADAKPDLSMGLMRGIASRIQMARQG
jgi:hypothetical protein